MDELEKFDELMSALRKSVLVDAVRIDPRIGAGLKADLESHAEHEARLTARRVLSPQTKIEDQPRPDHEKEIEEDRQAQARAARAVKDLEDERAAQPPEEL